MNERQQATSIDDRSPSVLSITLREKVDSHVRALENWANRLDRQRYSYDRRGTFNEAKHWKTRGSQKTLRWVARQLNAMRNQHETDYGLYKMLTDYLECLMTCSVDAYEEVQDLWKCQRKIVERWKAEGEAYVLPRICTKLSRLVKNHAPEDDVYSLSLDGKTIVSFPESDDEPVSVENACLPPMFDHGGYALFMPQGPRRSLKPERNAGWFPTPRSVVHEIVSVPLLGPFPVLPDGLSSYHQDALTSIESALTNHRSLLVKLSQGQDNIGAFLACLDRLLQYTYVSRILVVAAKASLKPELVGAYKEWVSYEDEATLSERYPVQTSLKGPVTACVCIASIRELQLAIQRAEPLPRETFDVIVLYGYPFLSQMWRTVLEYFTVPCRIGFSEALDDDLAAQFDHHIVFAIPGTEKSSSATSGPSPVPVFLSIPPWQNQEVNLSVETLAVYDDSMREEKMDHLRPVVYGERSEDDEYRVVNEPLRLGPADQEAH